ncbi:MAG: CBS domain-containing protein [Bacteroidota bacterium]|nr:CBS domain-containing protein [Bacteroidota bacterium]
MTADALINPSIPVLKPTDTAQDALDIMDEHKLIAMPVVSGNHFIGIVSEELLLEALNDDLVETIPLDPTDFYVKNNVHFFEIIKILSLNPAHIIAVLDDENNYIGAISSHEIIQYFGNIGFVNSPGGILVLSIPHQNYSLAEISRIAESNDLKIISSFVSGQFEKSYDISLTLKFNKSDLTRLIASFERYGFNVIAQFHESDFKNADEDRLHHLLKYLSI